jgi:hypothetical protein
MKILFIAEFRHYRDWIGKSYFDLINYVAANNIKNQIKIVYSDVEINNFIVEINEFHPELIVFFQTDRFYETSRFSFLFGLNIPIATVGLDYFYPSRVLSCQLMNRVDSMIHFSKNSSIEKYYSKVLPNKYITSFKSRYINIDRFKDYQLEKKYDILIYGTRNYNSNYKIEKLESIQNFLYKYEEAHNIQHNLNYNINFYSLRSKLEQIIIKNQDKYRCKILPEKCIYDAVYANEDLSKLINESYITVACSSIANILFHKYLEISASKSVILGDIPTDYEELLKGNIIEVNYFMNEDEIIEKIDNALANKGELNDMAERLYDKIHKEHNYDVAIEDFNEVFDNIVKNK